MKKAILLLFMVSLFIGCADEADPVEPIELTKGELLAGEESKIWVLFATTPEEEDCPEGAAHESDNTWTFFADGTFEFDHGTVTEDPVCQSSDTKNLTGVWEISEDDMHLEMTISFATDFPEMIFTEDENGYLNSTIVQLDENKLILSEEYEGEISTYEFILAE
jgi:hypothetical protein